MKDQATHDFFVKHVLAAMQDLEEIWGPGSYASYIAIMQDIKAEIERRIDTASHDMKAFNLP